MGNALNSAEIDAQIAKVLDEALGASNLSLRGLSEKSGVKLTRLGDILRRGRAITTGELQAVADALGLISWQIVRDAERALIPEFDDYELAALDPHYDPELEQF